MSRRIPGDWHDGTVPDNVELGARTWLYSSYAFLHHRSERPSAVRVGDDSGLYLGTFFDTGPEAEIEIGHHCALVGPILATRGRIEIGPYAFVSHETVIADEPVMVPPPAGSERRGSPGEEIVIGENVWIGVRAMVLGGARIGEGAIVGAAAVVDSEVPPYAIVAGNPAQVVGEAPPRRHR